MSDEKLVEVELLADGMRLHGRNYVRGDVVSLPEERVEVLLKHGVIGKKGSLKAAQEAEQERDAAEARRQVALKGHAEPAPARPARAAR
jgi:hypothetical protein